MAGRSSAGRTKKPMTKPKSSYLDSKMAKIMDPILPILYFGILGQYIWAPLEVQVHWKVQVSHQVGVELMSLGSFRRSVSCGQSLKALRSTMPRRHQQTA